MKRAIGLIAFTTVAYPLCFVMAVIVYGLYTLGVL